jgi:hypothetical protein
MSPLIRWGEDVEGRPVSTAGKIPATRKVLRVVCAWCRRVMRNGNSAPSHGICARCSADLEVGR